MLRSITCVCVVLMAAGVQGEVVIETVTVGNPGNAGELSGAGAGGPQAAGPDRICGAVDYVYNIGTFEVTAGQYMEFLNAVAATDTYGLYHTSMEDLTANLNGYGCNIVRSGSSGSYSYTVDPSWADRPVNWINWGDAARFANWLHNGQPMGAQDLSTTEDGSYYVNGAMSDAELMLVVRKPNATWVLPSEDEWYKAAYHYNDGVTGNYYDYPTRTDAGPNNGNPEGDTGNSASFDDGDYTIGGPYYRTQVKFFELSEGPYETFDQGGNVWEWNEAVIGSVRGLRGGSFDDGYNNLHAAARYCCGIDPSFEYFTHGIRIAIFADCNGNGIPDECDLDCGGTIGMTGGLCSDVYPECGGSTDENGNGVLDDCAPDIPAVSTWGLAILGILVLTVGSAVIGRRRNALV